MGSWHTYMGSNGLPYYLVTKRNEILMALMAVLLLILSQETTGIFFNKRQND